jgi:hypothetical protein
MRGCLKTKSLLFVDVGYDDTAEVQTLRLSAQHANSIPVAVAVATMGIEEVIALAGGDGVFRGGPATALHRQGQPAPPMRLSGSSSS